MMAKCGPASRLRQKFAAVWPLLDERTRRLMAASEAMALAYGGVSRRSTCLRVVAEGHRQGHPGNPSGAVLEPGASASRSGAQAYHGPDPRLLAALDRLIEPDTRGDPESPLRWVCKSTRTLAAELSAAAIPISHVKVAQLLHEQDYSLQGKRKTEEGSGPSRSRRAVPAHQRRGQASLGGREPGHFGGHQEEGIGRELRQRRPPMAPGRAGCAVQGHDFPSPEVPRAYPYGIYDMGRNAGFVNVGTDHDTAPSRSPPSAAGGERKADACTRSARRSSSRPTAGGSNGSRLRLWKWELQKLADETGLTHCRSAISRRAPASGTRSSIASSRSSPRTGEANPCATTRPSST